jgi:hypothetical protein
MKMRLVCLALLAVVFTRPVAASDVTCAQWLAYRAGDTSLQGEGPTFAAFIQGYLDAVNDFGELFGSIAPRPPGNFVRPKATFEGTAVALDRVCSVLDPTDSAIETGISDLRFEIQRRAQAMVDDICSSPACSVAAAATSEQACPPKRKR